MLDRTCVNLMNLDSLISWLKTKDPDAQYDWLDTHNCLICQYFHENGFPQASSGGSYTRPFGSGDRFIVSWPSGFTEIATGKWLVKEGKVQQLWTFGTALERAEAFKGAEAS